MRTTMFCVISLVALFVSLSSICFAQQRRDRAKIEITPFGGFQWNTRTNTYGGYISTKDGINFGGTIDFEVRPDFDIELLYIYFPSEAKIVIENAGFASYASEYVDIATHYMQIGYIRSIQKGKKFEPFGAVTIGAVLFQGSAVQLPNGSMVNGSDIWRFAVTLGGGAKIYFSDRIGLRLQARIMAPLYFAGAGLYFGTSGSGFGVSGGVPILQGDFTGGLIIRI